MLTLTNQNKLIMLSSEKKQSHPNYRENTSNNSGLDEENGQLKKQVTFVRQKYFSTRSGNLRLNLRKQKQFWSRKLNIWKPKFLNQTKEKLTSEE
jgi:hypothetical protein